MCFFYFCIKCFKYRCWPLDKISQFSGARCIEYFYIKCFAVFFYCHICHVYM